MGYAKTARQKYKKVYNLHECIKTLTYFNTFFLLLRFIIILIKKEKTNEC